MSFLNLENKVYGRWTVLSFYGRDKRNNILWKCKCVCGVEKNVYGNSLRSGQSTSCGCYNREVTSRPKSHGHAKHSKSSTEYYAWGHMKDRCFNKKNKQYSNYGGRGITVCERWANSFELFLKDVGFRPSPKHSLDRYPNNDGNYEPGNCKWRLVAEQNRNKRDNRWLESNGEKMVLTDWALKWGVSYQSIQKRLKKGQTFDSIYNLKQKV